jgi:hypothetical protein
VLPIHSRVVRSPLTSASAKEIQNLDDEFVPYRIIVGTGDRILSARHRLENRAARFDEALQLNMIKLVKYYAPPTLSGCHKTVKKVQILPKVRILWPATVMKGRRVAFGAAEIDELQRGIRQRWRHDRRAPT